MNVRPVLPSPAIIESLQPSLAIANFDWETVEKAIADRVACIWEVGGQAWIVTFCNADDEVEVLACGGRGAIACAAPFERAMRELSAHKGMTLRLEGRKAWKRIFKGWNCKELADGNVLLTRRV